MSPKESIITWFDAFIQNDYLDDEAHIVQDWHLIKCMFDIQDIKIGLQEGWIFLSQHEDNGDIEVTVNMVDDIPNDKIIILWLQGENIVQSLHLLDIEVYEMQIRQAYDQWGRPSTPDQPTKKECPPTPMKLPNGNVVNTIIDLVNGC